MVVIGVPRPLLPSTGGRRALIDRPASRRGDLEALGLLAGVFGILLTVVVIFGASPPV